MKIYRDVLVSIVTIVASIFSFSAMGDGYTDPFDGGNASESEFNTAYSVSGFDCVPKPTPKCCAHVQMLVCLYTSLFCWRKSALQPQPQMSESTVDTKMSDLP